MGKAKNKVDKMKLFGYLFGVSIGMLRLNYTDNLPDGGLLIDMVQDGNQTKPVVISEEVIFELQLAKTVMAALRGHYPDLGQTRILDIEGTYQNKDSIEDDIYPIEVTFYSDAGGLGGICKTGVNYMPKDPNLMQFLTMDCKRNPTLEEIDQYAAKELELKRAQAQQKQEWMDELYQEEVEAFNSAFEKLVDEGVIPPIPDDFEMVDLSEERLEELIELDIKTRRRAFAELNGMVFPDSSTASPEATPSDDPAV